MDHYLLSQLIVPTLSLDEPVARFIGMPAWWVTVHQTACLERHTVDQEVLAASSLTRSSPLR